jgi:hypothetical protein
VAGESPVTKFLGESVGSRLAKLLWGLVILVLVGLPLTLILRYIGRSDLTFQAVCCAGVLAVVIKVSGKLRTQWWFWATLIPIAGGHVLFILRVRWPEWVPSPILIAFAAVDSLMIFYILSLVGKLMGKEALVKKSFSGGRRTGN